MDPQHFQKKIVLKDDALGAVSSIIASQESLKQKVDYAAKA